MCKAKSRKKKAMKKTIELNEHQVAFLQAQQATKGVIGGRAGGKSVLMGYDMWCDAVALPQFSSCVVGKNFRELRQSMLPQALQFWHKMNFRQYDPVTGLGDYVKWQKPPRSFRRPHIEPEDWKFCITTRNGHCINLLSFYYADTNRGGTYQVINLDEAGFFKQENLKILTPMLRGNSDYELSKHYRANRFKFFTSPPYKPEGQWVWDYEELAKKDPDNYFFRWMPTIDNIDFLPNAFIKGLKNSLLDIEFRVEVLGERLSRISKAFYPAFDVEKHVVFPEDDYDQDFDDKHFDWVTSHKFYSTDAKIVASLDFNAHFTCCTNWQEHGMTSKCISDLFVKEADLGFTMVQTLAFRFLEKYKNHRKKTIILTGDRNGKNKSPNALFSMYENFGDILRAGGWEAILRPISFNRGHEMKYGFMVEVLNEKRTDLFRLRFDGNDCKSTIISIENSPLLSNYEKDKTSERPSKGVSQERATHLSDSVDYYVEYKRLGGLSNEPNSFDIELI